MLEVNIMEETRTMAFTFNENSIIRRHFLVKRHQASLSDKSKPEDRTLLVFGVPEYCTEEVLTHFFEEFGNVDKVLFQSTPSSGPPRESVSNSFDAKLAGFKVTYVVFSDAMSLSKIMSEKLMRRRPMFTKNINCTSGMKKWISEYANKNPPKEKLKREIEEYMAEYDAKEELKEKQGKEMSRTDEDGWITVGRGKKGGGGFKRKMAQDLEEATEKKRLKKAKQELPFFYTSQMRESKINHVKDLQRKFQDDKKRLAEIKERRKFKP